jgi:hypothetical protein
MRSRLEILRDLIALAAPLEQLRVELAEYEWDSPAALVTLGVGDIVRVLERFLVGDVSALNVNEWADAVEMRDDIQVADEVAREAIFDLANPALQGDLTVESAKLLIEHLKEEDPTQS